MILERFKTLRKSQTSIQREGQARSPTKSEWDSANAKPYKHTDDCSTKSEWDSANAKPYKHTDDCSTKSEWDSAENLIDGADGEQSLSLDGRKVCNIKRVGISQAESNKATVCALPSIHLPLTREARVLAIFEG